jgi:PAS domain S-box-containing protein
VAALSAELEQALGEVQRLEAEVARLQAVEREWRAQEQELQVHLAAASEDEHALQMAAAHARDDCAQVIGERDALAQQLHAAEHRLDALLSAVPSSIYVLTPDGTFAYVSQPVAQKLGMPQAEFVGKRWFQVPLPPQVEELFDRRRLEVLATGQVSTDELRLHTEQGVYAYEYTVAPIRDGHGVLTALMVIVRENPARVELEERLTRVRYALHETEKKLSRERTAREALEHALSEDPLTERMLGHGETPTLLLDAGGRVVRMSPACMHLSGTPEEDARGRAFWEVLVIPHDAESAQAAFHRSTNDGQPTLAQFTLRHATALPPYGWTFLPLTSPDGHLQHVLCLGNAIEGDIQS